MYRHPGVDDRIGSLNEPRSSPYSSGRRNLFQKPLVSCRVVRRGSILSGFLSRFLHQGLSVLGVSLGGLGLKFYTICFCQRSKTLVPSRV